VCVCCVFLSLYVCCVWACPLLAIRQKICPNAVAAESHHHPPPPAFNNKDSSTSDVAKALELPPPPFIP
jgi:hypothetical protein